MEWFGESTRGLACCFHNMLAGGREHQIAKQECCADVRCMPLLTDSQTDPEQHVCQVGINMICLSVITGLRLVRVRGCAIKAGAEAIPHPNTVRASAFAAL